MYKRYYTPKIELVAKELERVIGKKVRVPKKDTKRELWIDGVRVARVSCPKAIPFIEGIIFAKENEL